MIKKNRSLLIFLGFFVGFLLVFVLFSSNHKLKGKKSELTINAERNLGAFGYRKLVTIKDEQVFVTTEKSVTLLDIIKCSNKFLEREVYYHGEFIVFKNFVKASREYNCHESITLTAPGDFRFLDNVVPLVKRWAGPISIALYAPGFDFFSTLQSIAYLRHCETDLIRKFVTFHLFFEHDHRPVQVKPLVKAYENFHHPNCSQKPPYETVSDEDLYKAQKNLTYPINLARNIAKVNAQTHFVFPSDIELYPTSDFIPNFLNFVVNNPQYFERKSRNVFVLPVFEIKAEMSVPDNKTQLQAMLKNQSAILFHKTVCSVCHRIPRFDDWVKSNETTGLSTFTVGKRQGGQVVWEPFFVCTQREPLWDERFNWEGQSNKMCQAYHMCILDYDFVILDNAFLTHKPGVKKKKVQVLKYKDQISRNTRFLKEILKELQEIYGAKPQCKVTYYQ